jgi:glycine cleavage system H lipoate-binding protein
MQAHEFLTSYQAKAVEYLIAVAYLLLFVPFWRFVNGQKAAEQPVRAAVRERRRSAWFEMPDGVQFHPGHAWLRTNGGTVVALGLDDFAQKLVGPLSAVDLPPVGTALRQGEKAWRLRAGEKTIDMLAPVDGEIVAINADVAAAPDRIAADPYGEGWLLKVRPDKLDADLNQLLSGELARQWMENVTDSLRRRLSPELGLVLQDGGQPVHGLARELEPEGWVELCRSYFRS